MRPVGFQGTSAAVAGLGTRAFPFGRRRRRPGWPGRRGPPRTHATSGATTSRGTRLSYASGVVAEHVLVVAAFADPLVARAGREPERFERTGCEPAADSIAGRVDPGQCPVLVEHPNRVAVERRSPGSGGLRRRDIVAFTRPLNPSIRSTVPEAPLAVDDSGVYHPDGSEADGHAADARRDGDRPDQLAIR